MRLMREYLPVDLMGYLRRPPRRRTLRFPPAQLQATPADFLPRRSKRRTRRLKGKRLLL